MEDMVNAFLQLGNFIFNAFEESLGDFAKEDSGFAGGVQELCMCTAEQLLREQVKHLVDNIWRCENLFVGEVGEAGEYIGVIYVFLEVTHVAEPFYSGRVGILGPV